MVHHLQHGQQQQHTASPSRPPAAFQQQQHSAGPEARVPHQVAMAVLQPSPPAMSRPGIRPVELPPDVLRPLNQQQVSLKPFT